MSELALVCQLSFQCPYKQVFYNYQIEGNVTENRGKRKNYSKEVCYVESVKHSFFFFEGNLSNTVCYVEF